ncbi:hypothetical protein [Acinetobacter pullicarnis]|uniref:hypothetical protein n=1 Tax=Acinetobacter pullicarnis TaxID=2576829 RepID=UPI00148E956F|nr:hypothetical protein [Acinetobacter pullicarnis]
MNMKSNLPQHPCKGKCTAFKEEQCNTCLIAVEAEFLPGDVVVYSDSIDINSLHTIEAYQPNNHYWLAWDQLVRRDQIRSATTAELKARRRLPAPEMQGVTE